MFTKKYFQDRTILFLNLIVIIGATINVIAVMLRINTSQSIAIIRYQVALGMAGFQRASVVQLYSFPLMALVIALAAILISARLYHKRRALGVLFLVLAVIALFFNLIVSGAILNLQ